MTDLGNLIQQLGWQGETTLLKQALTHRSAARPGSGGGANEQLEFVGDRVLNLVVAAWVYRLNPQAHEGELALHHTALVRAEACAAVATQWGLEPLLVVGGGRQTLSAASRTRLLADTVEALLGALFLTQGYAPVAALIEQAWAPLLANAAVPQGKDAKTALQERLQAAALPLPTYTVVRQAGPDHAATFTVEVRCEWGHAIGEGRSKQAASLAAAQALLEQNPA